MTGAAIAVSTPPTRRISRIVTLLSALTNTLAEYSLPALTRRPSTVRYPGPPTGTAPRASRAVTSASVRVTDGSAAPSWAPAFGRVTVAVPGDTAKFDAAPVSAQAPPTSAEPRPPFTDRLKVSRTNGCTDPTTTVRCAVVVAPWSSVTVRLTGYWPAAA